MRKIYKKFNVLLLIGALAFLTGSVFAQDITIASGAIVTIDPGATVTGGVLDNSGTLTIKSDATGTGSLIVTSTGAATGTVNVERYIPSTNWHIVSSPVEGSDIATFAISGGIEEKSTKYAIGEYDVSGDSWEYYSTTINADFLKVKGYSIKRVDAQAAGVVTFTGTKIFAGNAGKGITNLGNGWNAIGNPYTSAIIAKGTNSFLENSGNINAIDPNYLGLYVWDQSLSSGTGDYTVISTGGGSFPGGEVELVQDNLAIGQGFIVKSKAGGATVSFTADMQVHATAAEAPFKSAEKPTPAVRLTVSSGDLVNRTVVSFDLESTRGLDPGYDVGKLKGNPNIALFTQLVDGSSDVDFMYQSVPNVNYELLTIPVGLDLKNGGDITFTLETSEGFPSDMKIYLEDKALNITTQLDSKNAIYSVSVPSLKGYGRFNLQFTNSTTGIDTDKLNTTNFNVFTRDRLIFVNGPADKDTRFSVYGIDGKMWYQNRAESTNQNTIDASGFAAGIYLIKIDKISGSQTLKVVLTN